jgi:hypothetical protein
VNRSLKIQLALEILAAISPASARPAAVGSQRLNVHLYDLANIAPQTLDEAAREAAWILATAGVEVVWQRGAADSPEAQASDQTATTAVSQFDTWDLVVRIVRGFPARSLPGALGYSLPNAQSGAHATVFYDRIEPLCQTGMISVPVLLGHAMAHEIGHVLIRTTEHSPGGIMKARWGKADYQRAAMGLLEFTPSQRATIREGLRARLARN